MPHDFDMLVIGGGAAGLAAAGISASLGAKTALVEARRLGGDCTWFGCIPSKTLLHEAAAGRAFAEAMERVRRVRQRVYEEADAPPVISRHGVEVWEGRARFLDPHTVEWTSAEGVSRRATARRFVIASGSTPAIPPIPGFESVACLTNETVFELTELPRRLLVLGAGPVGIEMAQAFRRLGSQVTVVGRAPRILPRDDAELAAMLRGNLESEGIRFALGAAASRVESAGAIRLTAGATFEADSLLLAAGRRSSIESLALERAGVATSASGVAVDRRCRTSTSHIYAVGDVTGLFRFTHMAEHMAKVAVTNALLHLPVKIDRNGLAWCTFTSPELAHAGRTEDELRRAGARYEVYRFPFTRLDRAIAEGETAGMVKVFARPRDGRIFGATILGSRAGDMIAEYSLAVRRGLSLRHIADTIHPYPTYALGNRRAADQWYARRLTPGLVRWLRLIFGWHGRLPDPPDPDRIV